MTKNQRIVFSFSTDEYKPVELGEDPEITRTETDQSIEITFTNRETGEGKILVVDKKSEKRCPCCVYELK